MRALYFALAMAACAFAPGCYPPASPPASEAPSRVTRANYDRIAVGMTLLEVENILGPAGATVGRDVKQAEGGIKKEIDGASWGEYKVQAPGGGAAQSQENHVIHVDLKDGKVTAKTQEGLD
jgi:hypothetical protein